MSSKPKEEKNEDNSESAVLEVSMEQLADAIVELLEKEYRSEVEPFEQYSRKVRLHLIKDLKNYAVRLQKGHEVLIEELPKLLDEEGKWKT